MSIRATTSPICQRSLPKCRVLSVLCRTELTALPELPNCQFLNATGCTLRAPEGTPVVPDIDRAILDAINRGTCSLDMLRWHFCDTTHCRAGMAIHLAGAAGYALEKRTSPSVAGTLIYAASRPGVPIPDFYASNRTAMADLVACAEGVGA